jgi:hypothetical protein
MARMDLPFGGYEISRTNSRAHSEKVELRFRKCASECALASLRLSHFLRKTGVHFSGKCSNQSWSSARWPRPQQSVRRRQRSLTRRFRLRTRHARRAVRPRR